MEGMCQMRQVYKTDGGEVRSWASIIDDQTIEQACSISRVPIVDGYLALMPDAHFGYGPPVGTALKTKGGVMPYAVGVDIGCGMIACKTDLSRDQLRGHEGPVLGNIRDLIPSGVGVSHNRPLPAAKEFVKDHGIPPGIDVLPDPDGASDRLMIQFGTLGAGNHFVEVCENDDEEIWLVLHSGSRGIGNMMATEYAKAARRLCDDEGLSKDLESWEFSYFPDAVADDYLADMLWCQEYAFMQREAMMESLIRAVEMEVGTYAVGVRVNCHHNYAERSGDGWLTRKGAIDASAGKLGVIPGSMGAATYIVEGLGNEESYCTSAHGAGRVLGRKQAHRTLDVEAFKKQMEGKTWLDRDAKKLLDEAPSAYKPIETVIADSEDLVKTVTVVRQIINYKGL